MTTAAIDNDNNGVADDVDLPIGFEDEWVPGDIFLDDDPLGAPLAPLDKSAGGNANVALWGGLVLLGRAPTNLSDFCGVGLTGMCTIEGLTVPGFPAADAMYGGVEAHDSSGIVQFVSVRHAGDEIGNSNELNGVTLGGVGDGTDLRFVEVYANFDDGIEWFGGTVNGNNLVVAFAGDDSFDADQGYTGVNQFLFGIMNFFNENDTGLFGTGSGDKACELDGDDFNEPSLNVNLVGPDSIVVAGHAAPWPMSHGIFNNMTIIGSTPDSGAPGTAVLYCDVASAANLGCQIATASPATSQQHRRQHRHAAGLRRSDRRRDRLLDLEQHRCQLRREGRRRPDPCLLLDLRRRARAPGRGRPGCPHQWRPRCGDCRRQRRGQQRRLPGLIEENQTLNPTGNAAGKLDATLIGANGLLNPRPAFGVVGVGSCAGPTEPGTTVARAIAAPSSVRRCGSGPPTGRSSTSPV